MRYVTGCLVSSDMQLELNSFGVAQPPSRKLRSSQLQSTPSRVASLPQVSQSHPWNMVKLIPPSRERCLGLMSTSLYAWVREGLVCMQGLPSCVLELRCYLKHPLQDCTPPSSRPGEKLGPNKLVRTHELPLCVLVHMHRRYERYTKANHGVDLAEPYPPADRV